MRNMSGSPTLGAQYLSIAEAVAFTAIEETFVWASRENNIFIWRPSWENSRLVETTKSNVQSLRSSSTIGNRNKVIVTCSSTILILRVMHDSIEKTWIESPFDQRQRSTDERCVTRESSDYLLLARLFEHRVQTAFTSINHEEAEDELPNTQAEWQFVNSRSPVDAEKIFDIGPSGHLLLQTGAIPTIHNGFTGQSFRLEESQLPNPISIVSLYGFVVLVERIDQEKISVCVSKEYWYPEPISQTENHDWLSLYTRTCCDAGHRSRIMRQRSLPCPVGLTSFTDGRESSILSELPPEILHLVFKSMDFAPLGDCTDPLSNVKRACRNLKQQVELYRDTRPWIVLSVCPRFWLPPGVLEVSSLTELMARATRIPEIIFAGCICPNACVWSSEETRNTFYG